MIKSKFGQWTVLAKAPGRQYQSSPQVFAFWLCECSCGIRREVMERNLKNGRSVSCGHGCIENLAALRMTHGHSVDRKPTATYNSWRAIRNRCYQKNHKSYARYGGAGIVMCDEWKDSFTSFLKDMGLRPSRKHFVDRIDGSKGYCKANCRWATYTEQNRNLSTNVYLVWQGQKLGLHDFADLIGVPYRVVLSRRKRGWSVERIAQTPYQSRSVKIKDTKL